MSKSALGRGLGDLMSGQKAPSNLPTSSAATDSSSPETNLTAPPAETSPETTTPGVSTLLRGKTETPKPEANPFAPSPAQSKPPVDWSFLKWILIAADVLLIIPTSFFVLTKSSRITFVEGTLCVVTFAFAAAVGCLALFIHRYGKK